MRFLVSLFRVFFSLLIYQSFSIRPLKLFDCQADRRSTKAVFTEQFREVRGVIIFHRRSSRVPGNLQSKWSLFSVDCRRPVEPAPRLVRCVRAPLDGALGLIYYGSNVADENNGAWKYSCFFCASCSEVWKSNVARKGQQYHGTIEKKCTK